MYMYVMYSKNSTHLDHNETTHYTTLSLPPPIFKAHAY